MISPLELICTVCLLPVVRNVTLAANPEAATNTSIWPPPAVRFRLASLQLPEMRLPWLVTSDSSRNAAVAGATESLLQTQPGAADIVAGLASDALGFSVKKPETVPLPYHDPLKPANGPRLGMAYRHRQHERAADPSSLDSLPEQPGTKQFHIEFSHSNDFLYKPGFPR